MGSLDEIKNELKHKKKTVDDLIRFIATRNENEPNYSLLLGAGCSVSSNIRSATALITMWERELYELSTGNSFEQTKAEEFFQTESWYDPKARYSCLFEKRYDLPKQRRAFIEQEVDKKIPSIGYAYLVKLIEKSYFRTIFTTNFDDLLNQSFYSHSKERPIVCAHDSSINSVTVTSKRPKIIKLHGDYLFDDIKSSQRETESLEENMKTKFVEFTRDYGLIVVGFAGNDRSIMDVLNYLLRHDEYLGHGIYWCIRKGSEVNSDLKRLLWHDRVFFVEVDGFDELFAEINAKVFKGQQLPYETRISSDLDGLLAEIQNNKKSFSSCRYIFEDLEKSENILMKEVIGNALKSFAEQNNESDYSPEENLTLSKIKDKTIKEKYEEALELIDISLARPKPDASKEWLIELHTSKAYALKRLDRIPEAAEAYRQAIDYMQENKVGNVLTTYDRLIEITQSPKEKLEIISKALNVYPYWSGAYFKKGEQLSLLFNHGIEKIAAKDVVDSYLRSISLDPSIAHNSNSYKSLCEFILANDLLSEFKQDFEKVLNAARDQDPQSRLVANISVKLLSHEKKSFNDISSYINNLREANKLPNRNLKYDLILLKACEKRGTLAELATCLLEMDKRYPKDNEFLDRKSDLLLQKFNDLQGAIKTCESLYEKNKDSHVALKLMRLYTYSKEFDKSRVVFDKHSEDPDFRDFAFNLFMAQGNKQEASKYLQDKNKLFTSVEYATLSCQLITMGEYQNAEDLLKTVNDETSFGNEVLVINYELAKHLAGEKINLKRVAQIRDSSKVAMERAAACCLLFDEKQQQHEREARDKFINETLDEDYETFFAMRAFPVFANVNLDSFQREKIDLEQESLNPKKRLENILKNRAA